MADIFRRYGAAWREQHWASLSTERRAAMIAIERCRTSALGGHVEQCDRSGERRIAPQVPVARPSGMDRGSAGGASRYAVFPCRLHRSRQDRRDCLPECQHVYNILFHAAAETLRTIAADRRHLGAEIGFFVVLHTWGQNLNDHPHLHCVVPGGGLSPDGNRWIACRPGFFLPVAVLSRLFRRLFLDGLQKAFEAGELRFFSSLERLRVPAIDGALRAAVATCLLRMYSKARAGHRLGTGVAEQLRSAADWAHFEPSLHSCSRLLPERQDTFTTALAHDVHAGHGLPVDLIEPETDQLRHAHACGEGQMQHGSITDAGHGARVWRV